MKIFNWLTNSITEYKGYSNIYERILDKKEYWKLPQIVRLALKEKDGYTYFPASKYPIYLNKNVNEEVYHDNENRIIVPFHAAVEFMTDGIFEFIDLDINRVGKKDTMPGIYELLYLQEEEIMEEQNGCMCCEEVKVPQRNEYVEKYEIDSINIVKIENGFLVKVEGKQFKNKGEDYDWDTKQYYVQNIDQIKDKLVEIYK